MKIPKLEIDSEKFYLIGKYAFFVTGLVGMIRILDLWNFLESYDVFSSIASVIFNFTLSAFFGYLQGKETVKEVNDSEILKMDEYLNKYEQEEKTNGKKK
jgi:hypothetical protein